MYKIQVLQNPSFPIQTGKVYSGTGKPISQFKIELAVAGDIDEMLNRIIEARQEEEFCYFEFQDIRGDYHSAPIVQGSKSKKQFDDKIDDMDVLLLEFIMDVSNLKV